MLSELFFRKVSIQKFKKYLTGSSTKTTNLTIEVEKQKAHIPFKKNKRRLNIERKRFRSHSLNDYRPNTSIPIADYIEFEDKNKKNNDPEQAHMVSFKYLIIDCSPINFIDTVGVNTLHQV